MADCGGKCGGGGGNSKPAASLKDGQDSSKGEKTAHACKCVCVCGTPTQRGGSYRPEFAPTSQPFLALDARSQPDEDIQVNLRAEGVDVPWTFYTPDRLLAPPLPKPKPNPMPEGEVPGAPGGPGIHAPKPGKPPETPEELFDRRNRRMPSAFALGRGMADAEAPVPEPIVDATWPVAQQPPPPPLRGNGQILYAPPQPVLDARSAPLNPVRALASWSPGGAMQGESSAVAAVMDAPSEAVGAWAYGGSVAPPDSTRFPSPEFPGPATLAPPHAGSFALGGPDAPPGAGVGARAFPVPGSDGSPRWTPSREAAKRTADSDLDAHRPLQALRMPADGIEGDSGPALEPVPLGVRTPDGLPSWRGVARPPLHPDEGPGLSRAALGGMVPLAASLGPTLSGRDPAETANLGSVFGPARDEVLRGATFAPPRGAERLGKDLAGVSMANSGVLGRGVPIAQPPAGPWDAGTPARAMPQVAGYDASAIAGPPLVPGGESATTAAEAGPAPSSANPRPSIPGLDALKAAMKGVVPVDQWRTPKPQMPGSPAGPRGRGPGLGAGAEISMAFEYAVKRQQDALAAFERASAALRASGEEDFDAARAAAYARYAFETAKEEVSILLVQVYEASKGAGSQWWDRAQEQYDRNQRADLAEKRRRAKKFDTRPNYWAWERGDFAEKRAQGVGDDIRAIQKKAKDLGDKLNPASAALLKKLLKDLKTQGKELGKKGSDAKDHSKGSDDDALAAVEDLDHTKEDFESTRRAIDDLLAGAEGKVSPAGPGCGGSGCGAAGGGGPAAGADVPPDGGPQKVEFTIKDAVWPDCGKKEEVCTPPPYPCTNPALEWVCNVDPGDPLPGGKGLDESDGSKGSGMGDGGSAPGEVRPGYLLTRHGWMPRALFPGDGPRPEPGVASPDAPPTPDSAYSPPADPSAQPSEEDLEFARQMARDQRAIAEEAERIDGRIVLLEREALPFYLKLSSWKDLKPKEEEQLASILRDLEIEHLALEFVEGLSRGNEIAAFVGVVGDGPSKDQIRRMSAGMVEAAKNARGLVEEALGAQEAILEAQRKARVIAGRGYTDQDLESAQSLLNNAWKGPPSRSLTAEQKDYFKQRFEPARKAIRSLGLDPDHTNAAEIAQRLFSQRRDAEMVAADEATSLSSIAWRKTVDALASIAEPVGRGLQATEKVLEAAVTGLQTLATAELAAKAHLLRRAGLDLPFFQPEAFEALASRQGEAFAESGKDVWRLLAARDLDQVKDRITQATLGGATLHVTEEEHRSGTDPLMDFARTFSVFNSATLQVTVGMLTGGGAAAGAKVMAGKVSALAVIRGAGASMANRIAEAARIMPRTVKGWVETAKAAIRSGVTVHGEEGLAARLFGRGGGVGKPRSVPAGDWWEVDPKLLTRPDIKGYTKIRGPNAGRVYINPDLDPIEKAITLRHEYVHRILTATADTPTGRLLQGGRAWLKRESALFHGLEETVAETVGAGWRGLGYTANPRVVLLRRAGIVDYAMGASALGAEGYYLVKQPVEPGQ